MSSNASAYEALGLEPDADPAAVELAYKRLIKRYHPDREGGDAERAAEINRAYFELRKPSAQPLERQQPRDLAEAIYAERLARRRYVGPRRRKRPLWPLLLILLAVVLYLKREPIFVLVADLRAGLTEKVSPHAEGNSTLASTNESGFDGPLHRSSIEKAVKRASLLAESGDTEKLTEESRTCHQELRAEPSLALLDRCAAFDDAVIEIENRGVIQEAGEFGASPVTARQMAAAKLLSNNYEAIEERLDRVRFEVQQSLIPAGPDSGVAKPAARSTAGLPPLVRGTDRPAAH